MYGVLLYQELMNHLDPDRPVYGVFLQEEVELVKTGKFDPKNSAFTSVPAIAARYIHAIRTLQPHGPYHLAGESFGGVVAYEMAQQLQATGEEVAIVALFDAWMSNGYAGMPVSQRLKLHLQLLSKHGLSHCTRIMQRRLQKVQQQLVAQLYRTHQQVQIRLGRLPQVVSESVQNDIRAEVREQASQSYIPQPYSGKLLLFRAAERNEFEVDQNQDMGWGHLAVGDLHIFDIPGDHLGILKDPNVRILAEKLQLHLD
jgi:thioesterase domain-containing protein